MFHFFKKKTYQPTITNEDKEWLENTFIWLITSFGYDRLKSTPFLVANYETFPYTNIHSDEQFQQLFLQLCAQWEVTPDDILIKIFDDNNTREWTRWVVTEGSTTAGSYRHILTTDTKRFHIELARSIFSEPEYLITVLAHELAHVKLLGGNYLKSDEPDMEQFTELTCIYFGFGVMMANTTQTKELTRLNAGYLPNQLISYANALICFITQHNPENYYSILNGNTKDLFKRDFEYLSHTHDTLLTPEKIAASDKTYHINKNVETSFNNHNFEDAIMFCNHLLELDSKNVAALNALGYALLMKKEYSEAIKWFNHAIDQDPYWDYPYNNRGYCKLQLGDCDGAYIDLTHSFDMNPENSFSHRNLGAYYLMTENYEKALEYFENTEKRDPKTEMINFYLAVTHHKMGNEEASQKHLSKSKESNEYNDSIIVFP